MYPVSETYINKLKSIDTKRRRIRGTLSNVSFDENDLLLQSFKYSGIAVSSADIRLGGVFVSSFSVTFLNSFASRITRGTWKDRVINVEIGLFLGYDENDQELWEYVPLQPFKIDEANHNALGVEVKAYDAMSEFDVPVSMNESSGKLFGYATLACNACGVTLGMTEEEMEALPNGEETVGLYPENDIETWRDLISWIAVTIGGFATINRDGELEFRVWGTTPVLEIDVNNRFTGGNWSDFETKYTAITVKNIYDDTSTYYNVSPDNGLTLDIGADPFLQYGAEEVKTAQRRAVLTAITNLRYVPFKSTSLIDPCLDLGDVILYTDGLAGNESLCCVMRIDFQYNKGVTLQGYGKNPALIGARSKTDKAISQASKGSKEQGLTYYTYINTTAISLTTEFQRLYRIIFIAIEKTTVTLWNEIKWLNTLVESTQKITYQYYLDGVKFDYEPIDTIGEDGYHSIPHPFWLLDVTGGDTHYWEVRAKVDSGTATIAIGDLHALLQGQKLAADISFDGTIEIEEEITPYVFGRNIVPLTDNVVIVDKRRPDHDLRVQQTIGTYEFGRLIVSLHDEIISLDRDHNPAVIVDESETYNIVDEDGTHNIKTEAWY